MSEDAYRRVTDPERFRPLHDVVRGLVAELVQRFDVDVHGLAVMPRTAGASPLTFTLTDFPGVRLAAGRHFDGTYPQCGCDACDEQLRDLVEELRWHVDAITGGGFVEHADGEGRTFSLATADRRQSGWTLEPTDDPPWAVDWAPWPTRPGAS